MSRCRLRRCHRCLRLKHLAYRTTTIKRPLRDEQDEVVLHLKGRLMTDSKLRDLEKVRLAEDVEACFRRKVLPHAVDAWINPETTKVGFEIPFNWHFSVFEIPRSLETIMI